MYLSKVNRVRRLGMRGMRGMGQSSDLWEILVGSGAVNPEQSVPTGSVPGPVSAGSSFDWSLIPKAIAAAGQVYTTVAQANAAVDIAKAQATSPWGVRSPVYGSAGSTPIYTATAGTNWAPLLLLSGAALLIYLLMRK
jgi:hypothetical protein